jgi:hypothetical protein
MSAGDNTTGNRFIFSPVPVHPESRILNPVSCIGVPERNWGQLLKIWGKLKG